MALPVVTTGLYDGPPPKAGPGLPLQIRLKSTPSVKFQLPSDCTVVCWTALVPGAFASLGREFNPWAWASVSLESSVTMHQTAAPPCEPLNNGNVTSSCATSTRADAGRSWVLPPPSDAEAAGEPNPPSGPVVSPRMLTGR